MDASCPPAPPPLGAPLCSHKKCGRPCAPLPAGAPGLVAGGDGERRAANQPSFYAHCSRDCSKGVCGHVAAAPAMTAEETEVLVEAVKSILLLFPALGESLNRGWSFASWSQVKR